MTNFGPGEIAYALGALVLLALMCMLYPHALRHAESHQGDTGVFGQVFRSLTWLLKFANVAGWSLAIAAMLTELNLPVEPRVIAISTALVAFSVMDMDNYLVKLKLREA